MRSMQKLCLLLTIIFYGVPQGATAFQLIDAQCMDPTTTTLSSRDFIVMDFKSTQCTDPTTATLSSTDIAVIEAVAKDYISSSSKREGKFVAILVECISGEFKFTLLPPLYFLENTSSNTLIADFAKRNIKTFQLEERIETGDIVIVGSNAVRKLVAQGQYKYEFPRSKGYVYMWLPGYKNDSTQAFVYSFCWLGIGSAYGSYLTKEGNEWIVDSFKELYHADYIIEPN